MNVNISFALYIDVIEFDAFLGDNIEEYQRAFDSWYYEAETSGYGGIVLKQRSELKYKILDVNVIIDWINEVSSNANVCILARGLTPGTEDPNLPTLCF